MRLPFPERVPIDRVMLFAVALSAIQWLEGTPPYFCVGCAAFIVIAAFAFNTAGGLTRASGVYIFFYSLLVVIIGICYKAFLGEPAQSNLLDPKTDIKVYVGGITAMLAAAVVSRLFSRKTGLLQNFLPEARMYRASVGCVVFGLVGTTLLSYLGSGTGSLQSAFLQLNDLIPLGIIIGVMYEIRRSGGTRSINLPILASIIYYFFIFGVVAFSKQGMLLPLVCWLFPVCALRFRLSIVQVVACLGAVFIVFYYLVPFAQYGRNQVQENMGFNDRLDLAVRLFDHPEKTRKEYDEAAANSGLNAYYNTPQGFWDRLQFVSVDDALNNITDNGVSLGLIPIQIELANSVPHALWPDKPSSNLGNVYAHEINGTPQGEGDTATGISFSPTAEAYHMKRWVGVLVIAPIFWFLLFVVFDSLFGDLRATPWGLLVIAMFAHAAPETYLTGVIHLLSFGLEVLIFCAFFATWFAPLFAIPVLGPERRRIQLQPAAAGPQSS